MLPLSLTPQMVRVVGFEPTISCSQSRRISHAFLHPIKNWRPRTVLSRVPMLKRHLHHLNASKADGGLYGI